jgi:inosine-uridine nucleoside N-ribohydrolase
MRRMKLIIDTDPGVDDAMAILYAAAHAGLDLIGLTTVFGNVPVATATRNALYLAEMTGREIPVAAGAAEPLVRPLPPHPDFVHGVEGFGDLPPARPRGRADPRPAARFLCETVAAHPGEVTLCAIGPLTNLAAALALDPAIAHNVDRVVVMGGAVECPGNVNADAEANIWNDPHAAAAVFAADWPVTLVGLDVTAGVNCSPADFAGLARRAPVIGGFLDRAVQLYFNFHRQRHDLDGCHMHDPTAVIEITDPGLFEVREGPVVVTLDGAAAGRTRVGPAGPAVRVCLGADAPAVRARFLEVIGTADACRGA